jgi:SNF2 family DNA or RNA helicase
VNGDAHTAPSKPEWANIRNSVTLCQYKSASRGIELVYATIAVYFSPTYSAEEYSQSLGRNHRNGTTKPTIVYCMRVQDTMEVDIWNCLKNKKNFIEKLYLEKHYD